MKKIFLASGLIAANLGMGVAQSAYDALTMSRENPVLGTARYTSMAGAMSAFGGDPSTMKDNPAGLGVYRKSDLSLTPNFNIDNDNEVGFNINNFGAVVNFGDYHRTKGYVTSSFGIAYNRLNNFSRSTYTEGTDLNGNAYNNQFTEDHGSGEWNFAFGVNLSNTLYLGLGLNAAVIDYTQSTLYNDGSEENSIDVDGSGFNVKVGAIVRPANFVRIGLSFQSPTWYNLNENGTSPNRDSDGNLVTDNYGNVQHSNYEADYDLQTPLKAGAGLGFVIDKRALIGIDYLYEDFSAMREKDGGGQFRDVKKVINDEMEKTHTVKVGAEVQVVKGVAVRAGYAYVSSPTKDLTFNDLANKTILYSVSMPKEQQYITAGLGYHGKNFYADLAYAHRRQKEEFFEWMENADIDGETYVKDPIKQTIKFNDISLTVGFRF